jgi:Skp family chaperone for outer membrane proteins
MDEDLVAMLAVLGLFVSFPIAVVAFTTGCIAYSRTKAWDKERNLKAVNAEASTLLPDADSEDDFLDTDDEAEQTARKTEEENDRFLTFGQMYRKQFRKVWSGKNAQQIVKEREREERRKLAKAVAREMDRRERRRARKAEREAGFEAAPPSYKN